MVQFAGKVPFEETKIGFELGGDNSHISKGIKRFLSLIVAAIAIFSMVVPVQAEQIVNTGGGGGGSITITNASQGQVYKIYKLFDATQSADGIVSNKIWPLSLPR